MITVGMHEAKTKLSQLVQRALEGEEVVIERRGKPVVRLQPVDEKKRTFADLFGTVPNLKIADDFDELPEDMARAFGMID